VVKFGSPMASRNPCTTASVAQQNNGCCDDRRAVSRGVAPLANHTHRVDPLWGARDPALPELPGHALPFEAPMSYDSWLEKPYRDAEHDCPDEDGDCQCAERAQDAKDDAAIDRADAIRKGEW
jgi:hypothetical protein